jgi:hypothetical protein
LSFTVLLKRKPGIHPGFHIGVELALFGGNLTALLLLGFTDFYDGTDRIYNYDKPIPTLPLPKSLLPIRIALFVFLGLFT